MRKVPDPIDPHHGKPSITAAIRCNAGRSCRLVRRGVRRTFIAVCILIISLTVANFPRDFDVIGKLVKMSIPLRE